MTFKEVYAAWKAEKKTSIRPSSFSTYVILMEKHVLPLIANKGPITESDVTVVREAVLASGTSERTAHDAVNVLMSILRYAGQQPICRAAGMVAGAHLDDLPRGEEGQGGVPSSLGPGAAGPYGSLQGGPQPG